MDRQNTTQNTPPEQTPGEKIASKIANAIDSLFGGGAVKSSAPRAAQPQGITLRYDTLSVSAPAGGRVSDAFRDFENDLGGLRLGTGVTITESLDGSVRVVQDNETTKPGAVYTATLRKEIKG